MSAQPEQWEVFGIPVFLTNQLEPSDVVVFTMVYEPTDEQPDRWRISAVKATGLSEDRVPMSTGPERPSEEYYRALDREDDPPMSTSNPRIASIPIIRVPLTWCGFERRLRDGRMAFACGGCLDVEKCAAEGECQRASDTSAGYSAGSASGT